MSKQDKDAFITQRPAFMIVQEQVDVPKYNGYTLFVDVDNKQASIINLTKGGKVTMLKQEVKALEGFEEIVEKLNEKKAGIEAEKAEAVRIAMEKIDADFAERVERIDKTLAELTVVEEIEVPDEEPVAEEVAEEAVEGIGIAF